MFTTLYTSSTLNISKETVVPLYGKLTKNLCGLRSGKTICCTDDSLPTCPISCILIWSDRVLKNNITQFSHFNFISKLIDKSNGFKKQPFSGCISSLYSISTKPNTYCSSYSIIFVLFKFIGNSWFIYTINTKYLNKYTTKYT